MVTHNLHQAIRWGSRLVMMHAGRVVLDLDGEAKDRLRVQDLVTKFYQASGTELAEDRLLLSHRFQTSDRHRGARGPRFSGPTHARGGLPCDARSLRG